MLEVQPTFVHAGVADALKSAGKWATPPLEEWTAVEAAIEKEKARLAAEAGRQREAAQQAEAAAERADADGGDAQGGAAAEHGLDSNGAYYPEQIRGHDRARTTERRRLLIKWRGWSCRPQDLMWLSRAQLIEDGHEQLDYEYSGRYAGGDDQVYELGQVTDSVGGRGAPHARSPALVVRCGCDAEFGRGRPRRDDNQPAQGRARGPGGVQDGPEAGAAAAAARANRRREDARAQDEEEGELAGEEGGEEGEEGEHGGDLRDKGARRVERP